MLSLRPFKAFERVEEPAEPKLLWRRPYLLAEKTDTLLELANVLDRYHVEPAAKYRPVKFASALSYKVKWQNVQEAL